jgi:hypothetical protein
VYVNSDSIQIYYGLLHFITISHTVTYHIQSHKHETDKTQYIIYIWHTQYFFLMLDIGMENKLHETGQNDLRDTNAIYCFVIKLNCFSRLSTDSGPSCD